MLPELSKRITEKGLKVTPQRLAVLEAVVTLNNHPTVEQIMASIRERHPNTALATVYKVLDALVISGLVKKVTTDHDIMRYEAVTAPHHHIYCSESDEIEDYYDPELNKILDIYFKKKKIPHFSIEELRLQIIGKYK